jgi:hypothetical protein
VDDELYVSIGAAGFRRSDERRRVSVHVDSAVDVVIIDGLATRAPKSHADASRSAYAAKYGESGDFLNWVISPRVAWGWKDGDVNTATKWSFKRDQQA